MSDSIFLDTNIVVYAHTDLDTAKQSVAQKLITENPYDPEGLPNCIPLQIFFL